MALIAADPEKQRMVLEALGYDHNKGQGDVQTIRQWLYAQPHLPHYLDDQSILAFLVGCKASVERTKQVLEAYFTVRGHLPDFYRDRDPAGEEIRQSATVVRYFPLPQLTSEAYRVNLTSLADPDPARFAFCPYAKRVLAMGDIRIRSEHHLLGEYMVYDCRGFTLAHLVKFTPILVKNFAYCGQDAMPSRLKGIFAINASPYAEKVINMFKPFLKPKLAKRVHVFSGDHTNLYKYIPREILPWDYGGDEDTMDNLNDSWQERFEANREWFLTEGLLVVDKAKRPKGMFANEDLIFGPTGNFKALVVD